MRGSYEEAPSVPNWMSPGKIILYIIIVIGLILLPGTCSVVDPGHRGIIVTMGKVSQDVRGEGLNFKAPLIQSMKKVSIQQFTVDGQAVCFSKDLQTVTVQYSALYKLPPDKVVELYQLYQGDPYASLVEPRLQDALKQTTAQYKAEDVVKNREAIKATVLKIMQKDLKGMVTLVDVPIKNIDLTEQLEKSIEDKQVQEQQALAKTYELQKAQKQAEITVVQAEAEAKAITIKGDAVTKNPKIIDLTIAEKWNSISPTTVVVSGDKTGANVMLPLK